MRLEHDEFVVTFDANKIGDSDIVATIKEAGYPAKVVTDTMGAESPEATAQVPDDPIFAEALARAKRENKPIVLDFYAQWCGPCLKMLKTTIPDPTLESRRCLNESSL